MKLIHLNNQIKEIMNREIKFRAWNPDDMKMEFPIVISICSNGKMQPLIKCSDGNNAYKDFPLMQFTSLKDKQGREIYVSDFVKHNNHTYLICDTVNMGICAIEVNNRSIIEMGVVNKENNHRNYHDLYCIRKYIEIIGNIHESPELLTP